MKSFTSTYVFSLFEKTNHIKATLKSIDEKSAPIDRNLLVPTMEIIDHMINIPIKKAILNEYNNGYIVFYKWNDNVVFPSGSLPVILRKTKNGLVSFVDITKYMSVTKNSVGEITEVKINEKRVFALMCTAWLYRHWFLDSESCSSNTTLIKLAANAYAKMVYKVLDRAYSVGVNYSSIDKSYTLLAQYFMHSVIETKYAVELAPTIECIDDKEAARQYAKSYESNIKRWNNLVDLINALNVNIPNLGTVDPKHFLSEFARIWGPGSIASLEYFPYFFMLLASATIGAGIAEDVKINGLLKKDIDTIILLLGEIYK